MKQTYRQGAKGALLDEYEKVIGELRQCVEDITEGDLATIVDIATADLNCRSIQTILSHVVNSAYGYATYIRNLYGYNLTRPDKTFHTNVKDYIKDLTAAFEYTVAVFENVKDSELEEFDQSKKITTSWGQYYDIEQMMEHAIVHIMRHRRQIEKFRTALKS